MKIEVSVTSTINVTAQIAQRKVSKLLLDQVGNLLYGEQPNLVAGQRLLWRVPIYGTGSLAMLETWLAQQLPCILFVRTGDLRP